MDCNELCIYVSASAGAVCLLLLLVIIRYIYSQSSSVVAPAPPPTPIPVSEEAAVMIDLFRLLSAEEYVCYLLAAYGWAYGIM